MIKLMKRSLILSSVLLSFGLATSVDLQQAIAAELNDKVDKTHDEADEKLIYKINHHDYELYTDVLPVRTDCYIHRDVESSLLLSDYIANQAIEQGMTKFGSAISDNIAKQYKTEIIPKFKEVISDTTKGFSTNDWVTLKWSTQPSSGLGEKIIHLYNGDSGKDILRFHVRRDQRPKQGYYFNFHYHTMFDNYESHNELGIVYWGKDMPPQWSSDTHDV